MDLIPDPAKGYRGNPQIGSNILLGDTQDDVRLFLHQFEIALFGGFGDKGKKVFHIVELALKHAVDQLIPQFRDLHRLTHYPHQVIFADPVKNARLHGFYRKDAGHVFPKALRGRKPFVFKEKLKRNVLSVFVHPDAQTALFDNEGPLRNVSFPQQNRFGGYFHPVVTADVLVPFVGELGEAVSVSFEHHSVTIKIARFFN